MPVMLMLSDTRDTDAISALGWSSAAILLE